jgi:hypothetical protein
MANPSKRKGSLWEGTVRDFLNDSGAFAHTVQRAPLWGALDRGDLLNTGAFTFECKATKSIDLASFVDEAEVEAKNAGTRWGAAVIKRRNHTTEKAYVCMTLRAFIEMLRELPLELR